ncbi:MAG: sigma-E factor negative regulatory protein [Xanthomonadales bacterium]|nr:sigma-E factor negative regulatory protein [Xanthomonadales bacterium]
MSENEKEMQLSCMMDGELGASQGSFLLRRLEHDQELESRWDRYHRIRDVMRKQPVQATCDLSERVAAVLADEPAPRPSGLPRWMKPAAGIAVAASVAVAAFSALYEDPVNPVPLDSVAAADSPAPTRNFANVPTVPQRAQVASGSVAPAAENPRLQAYIVRHNQASGRRGQGLVPYVYMVSSPNQDDDSEPAAGTDRDASD